MALTRTEMSRKLIVAAAITTILAACSNGPKSASKQFYSAIGHGETNQAMKMIDTVDLSPQAQAMGVTSKLRAAIESMHNRAEAHGGLERVNILTVKKLNDTHARVTAQMKFRDGTTQTSTDNWVKLKGKWLLDTAQN